MPHRPRTKADFAYELAMKATPARADMAIWNSKESAVFREAEPEVWYGMWLGYQVACLMQHMKTGLGIKDLG